MSALVRNPAAWFMALAALGAVAHGIGYAMATRRNP